MTESNGLPWAFQSGESDRDKNDCTSIDMKDHSLNTENRDESNSFSRCRAVAASIRKKLQDLRTPSSMRTPFPTCIFRVPKNQRISHNDAYTPRAVSIGPYHRRTDKRTRMEECKLQCLREFLLENGENKLEDYIEEIKYWEPEIRNFYAEQIKQDSDKLVEMVLIDGIFAIQLFRMNSSGAIPSQLNPWLIDTIRRDMTLLENQIPFFVIQTIFELTYPWQSLIPLAYGFFRPDMTPEEVLDSVGEGVVLHFLDLIRRSYLPPARSSLDSVGETIVSIGDSGGETIVSIPSLTDLVAAGVKLKKGTSRRPLDIDFKNGTLIIPPVNQFDVTGTFFRNMIAFEQVYLPDDGYLNDYVTFLDQLINHPSDAKLLIEKGIIENWLGDEYAVADLFNSCYGEGTLSWRHSAYLNTVRHGLINHYETRPNKWKATFKHDYCSSPWAIISVTGAVVLLVLTVVQTACSLLSLN